VGTSRLLCAFALVVGGACSDNSGCNTQPLPGGALPAAQTVEGGAQVRVTQAGVTKLESYAEGVISSQLANGFCLPEGNQFSVHYCYTQQGQCNPGCKVDVALNGTQFLSTNTSILTVRVDVDVNATIPTEQSLFQPCNIFADGNHIKGDANLELATDPTTGELTVAVKDITNIDLTGLVLTGDGTFCNGASGFADFLKDYLKQQIADLLKPKLNQLIQDFLPDPLGIEGVVDVGPMLASISPGTKGALETRIVPGGFARVDKDATGLALGVITGINSDEDPNTRNAGSDSEPAFCVPPLTAPDLALSPFSLGKTTRGTFSIPVAPGFLTDVPGKDVTFGISRTTLRQIGHHAVTSGIMCLGIGTSVVPQLNVGTFGLLVPSVGELANDDGKDPVLLVVRPQERVDFSIGDNTATSPALTVHLKNVEIDVYPFLFERYVRAFTMSTTLDLGINLEFDHPTGSPWRVTPKLVGLGASAVHVQVLDSDFIKEKPAQLESALPSVFDLLASQLSIPPIELPSFAGFNISDPSVSKLTGGLDEFLAISAVIDVPANAAPPPAVGVARIHAVVVPPIERVREGVIPTVTLDLDRYDAHGRELEWTWRLGQGLWRPFVTGGTLVINDRALAWQGEYSVGLISRVKGVPGTESAEQTLPVVIDSVAPHVVTKNIAWDGEDFVVPGYDIVGGTAIRMAFGVAGEDAPRTAWQDGGTARLDRATVDALVRGGDLAVFLVDASGNQTVALVQPFHGQAGASGCSCETGSPTGGALLLLAIAAVLRPRRRSR
jgi:MYXO-CTERM domain-containing protein